MVGGELQPGDLVGDSYRLVRLLGEGGMGWVWRATSLATNQQVALKLLKGGKEEDRKRFLREVRAAAAIRHPNVIAVHDLVELPGGTLVIVMDLLEGETLGAVLRRDRRISLADLASVILPVLEALEAAHALGIVHRDLKPDNIFLCRRDEELEVKVLDFGVAKLTAEDGLAARTQALTGTGSMVGTPYYMSPEQVFADKDLDARADVWSLGIVMYECLSGVRPTEADTVGRVLKRIMEASFEPLAVHDAGLPDDAVALVASALAVDRGARPGLAAIRAVLARHARAGVPSFSRAPAVEAIDPHAATVITPHDEPRAHAAHAPNDAEALAGIDTNRAVSVMPPARGRARTRFVGYGALAVVLLLAGLVALRGRPSAEEKPFVDPTSAVSIALNEPPPRPSASASPRASAAEERAPTPPSSATSLSTAPAAVPPPRLRPSPVGAGVAPGTTVLSRPACEAGEVSSEGHCCPRGHEWRGGRCERPLATSF